MMSPAIACGPVSTAPRGGLQRRLPAAGTAGYVATCGGFPQDADLRLILEAWDGYNRSGQVYTEVSTTSSSCVHAFEASDRPYMIGLVAESDAEADACNWIGASSSEVQIPNPPQLSNAVDLHILADQPMAATTQAPAREMNWDVSVSSANGQPVTSTFPDLSAVPNRYRLTLVDEAAGKTVNMHTTNAYTAHRDASLKIIAAGGNGNTLTVSGVSTEQVGSQATIAYKLSASAQVTVQIRNIAGRLISRIGCGTETAGLNSATWNLRNRSGAVVPSGTYLCTITARADDGTQTTTARTMQISR